MIINKHKIEELIPSEYNPRKINEKQMSDLKKSIVNYGIVDPIIININQDRKNIVIGGHQRLKACKELGYTEIDCVELDLSISREKELNVRLNKNNGEFDFHELIEHFSREEALEYGFDLKDIENGLNREEVKLSRNKIKDSNYREDNKQRYLDKWKVQVGDLWQVGEHKLLCGDSLKKESYDTLLENEKVQLIFTDPPYVVDYRDTVGGFKAIENDKLKTEELYTFLDKFISLSVDRLEDKGSAYIWHAYKTRRIFEDAIRNNKLKELSYIIWVKDSIAVNFFYYRNQYEPCFFLCKDGESPDYWGSPEDSMVWELNNQDEKENVKSVNLGNGIKLEQEGKDPLIIVKGGVNKKLRTITLNTSDKLIIENDNTNDTWYVKRDPAVQYLHPTQKPVDLAIKAINNSTRILESVLDPFAGSGFTLLACEKINRKARCIELDPGYCATILERFNKATGITPFKK